MVQEESLKKLQTCLILIADEIKRICDNNSIKFFLMGGSLLGAVRHEGIIPWDDDLDIGMLRDDYEAFIMACEQELRKDFILCNPYSEEGYGVPFTKIRLKGTRFEDEGVPDTVNNGIFIDVFPIDVLPDSKIQRYWQNIHVKLWRNALAAKCGYGGNDKKVRFRRIVMSPFLLLKQSTLANKVDKWEKKYNGIRSDMYVNFTSAYSFGKEIFPKETLEGLLPLVRFESLMLPTPRNPEYSLSKLYGDYMRFPPIEDRVPKHVCSEIDFGEYENILLR